MEDNENKVVTAVDEEAAKPVYGWRTATAGGAAAEVAKETAEALEEAAEAAVENDATEAASAEEAVEAAAAEDEETIGEAAAEAESATEAAEEADQPKPKFSIKQIKPWMWAVAAAVVIAIIGFAGFNMMQSQSYDQAGKDYANGEYVKAAEAYQKLGNYQDSAAMYEKASKWVDAQAAEEAAKNKQDASLWAAAAEAYGAIDEENAQLDALRCSGNADYYTAKAMLEKKPTDRKTVSEALPLFKNCTEIADAAKQVSYCENVLDYYEAGDLAAEGHYYDAYKAYGQISNDAAEKLGDVDKKMNACKQSLPGNGVVWRSGDAPGDSCELTIVNSGNPNAYYKLYMGDALVMTVFISAGDTATFSLPSGTFSMNKAYGDDWFGTEDMFGDEGSYFVCNFGGSKTFTLDSGNAYEISTSGEGTGIGTQSANRNSI
ncbi:MAG: hypothetical protein IKF56_06880 [Eggerthellaceae bacterium]|nr:hypothetical protein [Eggerthellaceae bacterium]